MKYRILFFTLVLMQTLWSVTYGQMDAQVARPMGINLTVIVDWSSEYVFVDAFKQSRQWIAHETGSNKPWSSEIEIPLSPQGYPLEIPYDNGIDPPQGIRTLMFFGALENRYPGGNYRLIASGSGQISLWGAAVGNFSCPVDTTVEVDPSKGGIALEIERSDREDPVHSIHFVMPGYENTFSKEPFHPELLEFLKDFQVIRFMDWMKTNHSPVTEWTDRNMPSDYTQTLSNGVAYEYLIQLCNSLGKDPWICIPHQASDDFIYQFAAMLLEQLDPERRIYLEYSNEVWNGIFSQNSFAQSMGNALGFSGQPWEQGWKFYVSRTMDVFRIFEEVFDDDTRLVRVLAGQSANSWLNNRLIEYAQDPLYNPNGTPVDALAIAPYFGGSVADAIGNAGLAASSTIESILDSLEYSLERSFTDMDSNKAVADEHGLALLAYEGGQHLVASYLYHNDAGYVDKLKDANRHPRMKDLYCQYFDHWYELTGGNLFCHFSSHGTYSKYGSWGVREFMDDTEAPKYRGLQDCVFLFNDSQTRVLQSSDALPYSLYPNPASQGEVHIKGTFIDPMVRVFDLSGHLVPAITRFESPGLINIDIARKGLFLVVIYDQGETRLFKMIRA